MSPLARAYCSAVRAGEIAEDSPVEHGVTLYRDPPPDSDLFDRMENILRERRFAKIMAATKAVHLATLGERQLMLNLEAALTNEMTTAAMRQAELELEAIEVARLIVAEANNAELIAAL
jgi:hypothetical protein